MTIVTTANIKQVGCYLQAWNRNSTCWSHLPITAEYQETVPESTTNRCTKLQAAGRIQKTEDKRRDKFDIFTAPNYDKD
jgi:hypothetical protein